MNEFRRLREEAGLTQDEVCARTGIARPNLSALETGRRTGSGELLERVRSACRRLPHEVLDAYAEQVRELVREHHGTAVAVFGSVARRDDRWNSDIDLLVDFERGHGTFNQMRLWRALTDLLGTEVDLVSRAALYAGADRGFDRKVLDEAVTL